MSLKIRKIVTMLRKKAKNGTSSRKTLGATYLNIDFLGLNLLVILLFIYLVFINCMHNYLHFTPVTLQYSLRSSRDSYTVKSKQ